MTAIPKGERIVKANSLTEFRNRMKNAGVHIESHDGISTVTSIGVFTLAFEEIMCNAKPITNDELDALMGAVAPAKTSKKQNPTPVPEIEKDEEDESPEHVEEAPRKEGSIQAASSSGGEMWD